MHIHDLPQRSQDVLKAIWDISERTEGATVSHGDLAQQTGQKGSTTTEAVKRLSRQGLVGHEPYGGISLTNEGKELAKDMVRRHRLLETFLAEVLDYPWDEVHSDADLLEHAVSDRLMGRIDAYLGHPRRDPHGDPIPAADGMIEPLSGRSIAEIMPGEVVDIEQVDDRDPELLRYAAAHGIVPGAHVEVAGPISAGILMVKVDGAQVALAESSLGAIRVRADRESARWP